MYSASIGADLQVPVLCLQSYLIFVFGRISDQSVQLPKEFPFFPQFIILARRFSLLALVELFSQFLESRDRGGGNASRCVRRDIQQEVPMERHDLPIRRIQLRDGFQRFIRLPEPFLRDRDAVFVPQLVRLALEHLMRLKGFLERRHLGIKDVCGPGYVQGRLDRKGAFDKGAFLAIIEHDQAIRI